MREEFRWEGSRGEEFRGEGYHGEESRAGGIPCGRKPVWEEFRGRNPVGGVPCGRNPDGILEDKTNWSFTDGCNLEEEAN